MRERKGGRKVREREVGGKEGGRREGGREGGKRRSETRTCMGALKRCLV